jgi:hypothetical protein
MILPFRFPAELIPLVVGIGKRRRKPSGEKHPPPASGFRNLYGGAAHPVKSGHA